MGVEREKAQRTESLCSQKLPDINEGSANDSAEGYP
jgi:hypothetical protein